MRERESRVRTQPSALPSLSVARPIVITFQGQPSLFPVQAGALEWGWTNGNREQFARVTKHSSVMSLVLYYSHFNEMRCGAVGAGMVAHAECCRDANEK